MYSTRLQYRTNIWAPFIKLCTGKCHISAFVSLLYGRTLHDNSELLREGKDVLDGILNTVIPESDARKAIGHVVQIKGLCAQVISIYLTNTGMYVAVPIFKIHFPSSLLELDGLKKILFVLRTY
ncbi:hypothetical protein EDC94DRAFT_607577 [Helicostylum pulchrum]|nr:hypothetical protein EDC94DRAFT_607577 [Helicostylum pulchrum]